MGDGGDDSTRAYACTRENQVSRATCMRTCVCNTYACTSSERATCVCACIHVGRQACHLCVRAYTWADGRQAGGVHVRATGGHVGRQAGRSKKPKNWEQFSEMETPHARFKTFPIARAHVKSIYYPLPQIVQLCWIMLVYVEFMLV